MAPERKFFYENVKRLGNVAVSRHALSEMDKNDISHEAFESCLLYPTRADVPDGIDVLWRERGGLRIIILTNPTPNVGAKLVKTVFRIQGQADARTWR